MKHHHHVEQDTTFLQKTGAGVRKHWFVATMVTAISGLVSTTVPLIEQWHSDRVTADAIKDVKDEAAGDLKDSEARLQKQIDELKHQQERRGR